MVRYSVPGQLYSLNPLNNSWSTNIMDSSMNYTIWSKWFMRRHSTWIKKPSSKIRMDK